MPSNRQPSTKKLGRNDQHHPSTVGEARLGVSESPASSNNVLIWAQYSKLAKVKPNLAPSITPADLEFGRPSATLWTWICESMMLGFALYGASIHPTTFLPVHYYGTEQPINPPSEVSSEKCDADPAPSEVGLLRPRWLAAFPWFDKFGECGGAHRTGPLPPSGPNGRGSATSRAP
jgi:hypothetical protein